MKKTKRLSMITSIVLSVMLLSFSVYAASAIATSTYAEAHVSTSTAADLMAVARLGNAGGWTGDSLESYTTSLDAYGYASNLSGPAQVSRASAWIGDNEVADDHWPKG